MNQHTTAQDEIAEYVAQVRLALGGVPESVRDELLEDLPEHLTEVLSEGVGDLEQRLGPPSAYAAELLAAAGFVGGFPDPPPRRDRVAELSRQIGRALRQADTRLGPVLGYARASEFLVLLRPAWWVLRGYLAAMLVAHLLDNSGQAIGLLPRIGGSDVVALLLLAAGIVGSIWLGRRGTPAKPWPRYALRAGSAVLVIFAWAGFVGADSDSRDGSSFVDAGYSGSRFDEVNDVFVYDAEGRIVEGAQLYDQNGTPILMGHTWCQDPQTGEMASSRSRGYPHCPELNPFRSPAAPPPAEHNVPSEPGPSPSAADPSPSAPTSTPRR